MTLNEIPWKICHAIIKFHRRITYAENSVKPCQIPNNCYESCLHNKSVKRKFHHEAWTNLRETSNYTHVFFTKFITWYPKRISYNYRYLHIIFCGDFGGQIFCDIFSQESWLFKQGWAVHWEMFMDTWILMWSLFIEIKNRRLAGSSTGGGKRNRLVNLLKMLVKNV